MQSIETSYLVKNGSNTEYQMLKVSLCLKMIPLLEFDASNMYENVATLATRVENLGNTERENHISQLVNL